MLHLPSLGRTSVFKGMAFRITVRNFIGMKRVLSFRWENGIYTESCLWNNNPVEKIEITIYISIYLSAI